MWKIASKEAATEEGQPRNFPTNFKCPFSGMNVDIPFSVFKSPSSHTPSPRAVTSASEAAASPGSITPTATNGGTTPTMVGRCPVSRGSVSNAIHLVDAALAEVERDVVPTSETAEEEEERDAEDDEETYDYEVPLKRASLTSTTDETLSNSEDNDDGEEDGDISSSSSSDDDNVPTANGTTATTSTNIIDTSNSSIKVVDVTPPTSPYKMMMMTEKNQKRSFPTPPMMMMSPHMVSRRSSNGTHRDVGMMSSHDSTIASGYSTATSHYGINAPSSNHDATSTVMTGGLSAKATRKLFPYHVVLDEEFHIRSLGNDLPRVLLMHSKLLIGQHVDDVFEITKPMGAGLSADWVAKLEDQNFTVEPTLLHLANAQIVFSASLVILSEYPLQTMLILSPDAKNLDELRDMNLTLSDLPAHGAYRDAIFLREHLSTQMNNALNMEKLSKSLQREKTLLESLLPAHAAEGLRKGQTVTPRMHNSVTIFFSDIVGFTTMCDQIQPYEVIGILNRLYCVMDYLAMKFDLFKIETIGDAYVCCSGLPSADPNHAEKVANFALAVQHCSKHVTSPIGDGSQPIQLRIGLHSGTCASGIVGVTNPRYCVFGDTVNTTARHESTGEAGKIHISTATMKELEAKGSNKFHCEKRGIVTMKGKGDMVTYWLHSTSTNANVNDEALLKLDEEVKQLLLKTDFSSISDYVEEERSEHMATTATKTTAASVAGGDAVAAAAGGGGGGCPFHHDKKQKVKKTSIDSQLVQPDAGKDEEDEIEAKDETNDETPPTIIKVASIKRKPRLTREENIRNTIGRARAKMQQIKEHQVRMRSSYGTTTAIM